MRRDVFQGGPRKASTRPTNGCGLGPHLEASMSMPGDGNNPKPSSPSQAPEGADGGAPVNQNVSIDSNPSVEPPTIAADENATGAYRPKNDDKSISDRIAKPPAAGKRSEAAAGPTVRPVSHRKGIGPGRHGPSFLALDTQLDRKVALKVPSFRFGETEELIVRFYREARAWRRCIIPTSARFTTSERLTANCSCPWHSLKAGRCPRTCAKELGCRLAWRRADPRRLPSPCKRRMRPASSIAISSPPT